MRFGAGSREFVARARLQRGARTLLFSGAPFTIVMIGD